MALIDNHDMVPARCCRLSAAIDSRQKQSQHAVNIAMGSSRRSPGKRHTRNTMKAADYQ